MKIIGGRDYYDNGMGLGHDDSIVLVRRPNAGETMVSPFSREEICEFQGEGGHITKVPRAPKCFKSLEPKSIAGGSWLLSYEDNVANDGDYSIYLSSFSIMFCGKIYYGIAVRQFTKNDGSNFGKSLLKENKSTLENDPSFFYSYENLEEFLVGHGVKMNTLNHNRRYHPSTDYYKEFKKAASKCFKIEDVSGELMNWILDNKVSIITWYGKTGIITDGPIHINDDNLRFFNFYRVMDSYTAFQELEMWIGGVLPNAGKPMAKLNDKELVQKHGYDKWSFRNMPSKKRKSK